MFLVLKDQQNHPALTNPYKSDFYYNEMSKAKDLKEFVSNVFSVTYCESIDELLNLVEN